MYLRRCYRNEDGKRHAYWALVESHRTAREPWQRVVAWLGELDDHGRLAIRQGNGYQGSLFDNEEPEWIEVDLKRIAHRKKIGSQSFSLVIDDLRFFLVYSSAIATMRFTGKVTGKVWPKW